MTAFLLMNLIVCTSAFLLTYRVLKFSNFIDSILSLFVLYFAQIVFTELLLGIFGILYLSNVVWFNIVIFLIIWQIARKRDSSFRFIDQDILTEFLSNKVILWGVCVILGFGLVKVFINLVNPPFGWDNLNYHFTFPVEWLKHGNLDTPIIVSDDFAPTYYPINGSLFFLWLILPFRSVFLADLGSLPFFIISGLVMYAISRKIGLERKLSFYSASLFMLIPNFFKQLEIAYVDIMVCAFFLITLYYILKLKDEFRFKNIILSGIAAGLLIGTKTLSLAYAATLFLAVFYLCLLNIENKGVIYCLIFLALVILFGGFSYIRNVTWTGNPLYPIDVQFLGMTIFKGVIDRLSYSAHFLAKDYNISKLLFHEGLGLQTLLFIVPGVFLGLVLSFIKERKKISIFWIYFLCLPILLWLIWRCIIPLANARYLYPVLAIAMIIGFYIFNLLKIPLKIIKVLTVICVLSSISELSGHMELFLSLILATALFFILYKNYLKLKIIMPALLILFIIISPFLEKDYVKNEFSRYKNTPFWKEATLAWAWLNEHTQHNNISYVGRPVPFPLYGSRFKNNVYYTSLNSIDPAKIHSFKDSRYKWEYDFRACHQNYEADNNYRGRANYQIWLNNLKRRKTDYLFIYSLHQIKGIEFPIEDRWANLHPEVFNPVFANDIIHIYKIK